MTRKIAFYASGECYGGLEKNALHLIQWLGDELNEISLFTSQDSQMAKAAQGKGIPLSYIEKTRHYIDFRRAKNLSQVLIENEFQVLFIIRPRDILMGSLVKTFYYRKLKLVYFQQSFLNLKKHPVLYKLLFHPLDAWIAPSVNIGKKTLEISGYNPAKMLIVPPCIDSEHFSYDTLTKKAARKILNLPPKKLIIGALGRYDHKNRLDFFIRATQFLKRNNYEIDLLIMGKSATEEEEEYLEFLKDLTGECGVEKQVHFRPYNDNLLTFFHSLDIFVTNWEPKPYEMILPKAMASGVVVVAPFSEVNSELLAKGNYGMLYKIRDLADFSSKIIHLITQPILRKHLVEVGQKIIFENYDRRVSCLKLNDMISKLLE